MKLRPCIATHTRFVLSVALVTTLALLAQGYVFEGYGCGVAHLGTALVAMALIASISYLVSQRARLLVGAAVQSRDAELARSDLLLREVQAQRGALEDSLETLEEERTSMQTVLDVVDQPIFIMDVRTMRVVQANLAAREEGLVIGASCQDHAVLRLPHCTPGSGSCVVAQAVQQRAPQHLQRASEDSDGRRRVLSVDVWPMSGQAAPRVLYSFRDISERRRLESQSATEDRLASVGRLAAGVAHEINTPLQYVSDNLSFLHESAGEIFSLMDRFMALEEAARREGLFPELLARLAEAREELDLEFIQSEVPQAFERAVEGASRVSEIVRSMKEFAHQGSGRPEPADLNRAMQVCLTMARNEYKYVADVETDLGELPPVECREGDLKQVFLNLVVNAAHAIGDVVAGTAERGSIRVRTRHVDDHVIIEVSDTGGGIPEDIQGRVFDPFFTTKEVGRGSGQGLAIARNVVVEQHGGRLDFQTRAGEGTTFRVILPVVAHSQRTEAT